MAGFNKVILLGNLTRDPQLKYLPSNTPVCELGLAVSRRWRDREGNMRDEVCFVDLTAFGRSAETLNQYMSKGKPILIEGRLKLDTWTAQDGTRRSKHSVVIDHFQFVGSREGGGGAGDGGYSQPQRSGGYGQQQGGGYAQPPAGGNPPPAPEPNAPPPAAPADAPPPPSEDDIPF